ncbi:MAG: hypothetical protein K0S09_1916 [Sphingobacteriaceae bacterium]|jgi:hypothetical protein|nr:hypothetical protein [Sphingobacteriaceae bacterium]
MSGDEVWDTEIVNELVFGVNYFAFYMLEKAFFIKVLR